MLFWFRTPNRKPIVLLVRILCATSKHSLLLLLKKAVVLRYRSSISMRHHKLNKFHQPQIFALVYTLITDTWSKPKFRAYQPVTQSRIVCCPWIPNPYSSSNLEFGSKPFDLIRHKIKRPQHSTSDRILIERFGSEIKI